MHRIKRRLLSAGLTFLIMALAACGGPEEKKARFFNRGKTLFEQGEFVKARLEFKNALQIDPRYAEGLYWLGMAELRQGRLQPAFDAFSNAISLDPDLMDAQLELGRMFFLSRARDKAMTKAKLVLTKEPDNPHALLLKGSLLLGDKQADAVIEIMQGLIGSGFKKPEVYQLLAGAHLYNRDFVKADAAFKEGLAANPASVSLLLALTKLYRDNGRIDDAAGVMARVIELFPDNPVYKVNLAGFHWEDGRRKAAGDLMDGIVSADPGNVDNLVMVTEFYTSRQDFDEAEQVLKSGIAAIPDSFRLRLTLGDLYARQKKNAGGRSHPGTLPDPG